jgi:hypothetical protein
LNHTNDVKNRLLTALGLTLSLLGQESLRANTLTATNGLSANIEAIGDLSVTGSVSLTNSGTTFNVFTGNDTVQYKARTTSTGGGTITLKATADFAVGGPSVSRGDLSYTCGTAGLGTACSSTTVSTSTATTVVSLPKSGCTGGGGACSPSNPNSVLVTFNLVDDPSDKTGSYMATIQFTISAT